jgi:putative inorganic carbon (HCO3(-)) transporter
MADLFALRIGAIVRAFRREHISFWAVCGYLFIEYVRPQSIIPALDILPWGKMFLLISAVSWLADSKQRWVSDPINKWMLLFGATIVLSSFTAYWPNESISKLMDFFGWFVIYFLILNIVNTEKRLFLFLLLFLLASFKMSQHGARTWAMRGFSFESWGLMGPPGFFENSGELSVQMLMFMPIAYRLAMAIRPWLTRMKFWFMLLLPGTAAMTVVGASSRGSQLGMAVQIYHTFLKGRLSIRTIFLAIVVAITGALLLPEEQWARFREAGSDETSQQRLLYWKHGLTMIQEHPILGVGYFNFPPYFALNHSEDIMFGTAQLPHNIFIQVGTDAGLTGLLLYGALIVAGFRGTRAIRKRLANHRNHWLYSISHGYDAAFIGFLIAGQFVTIGYYPFMWIQLALIAATRNVVLNTNLSPSPLPEPETEGSVNEAPKRHRLRASTRASR